MSPTLKPAKEVSPVTGLPSSVWSTSAGSAVTQALARAPRTFSTTALVGWPRLLRPLPTEITATSGRSRFIQSLLVDDALPWWLTWSTSTPSGPSSG